MAANMRAKVRVSQIDDAKASDGQLCGQTLHFQAVAASQYPEDGSDENNTFAKYTPSAYFTIDVRNSALFEKFAVGEEYYVDFTPAQKA